MKRKKILWVDDDTDIIKQGKEYLEGEGYNVLITTNGKEAIEIYQKQGEEINIVILDVDMPEMNGIEVFEEIKKINPRVNVLFLSGKYHPELKGIIEKEKVLKKPIKPEEFLEKIREII